MDIANFYWRLEDGRIWHSGRGASVPAGDKALAAWQAETGLGPVTSSVELVTDLLSRNGFAAKAPGSATTFAVLSPVQLRLAMIAGGLALADIDAAIGAIEDAEQRDIARTYWDYSTEYHRGHPMIPTLAALIGMTSAQVDEMWRAAAAA